MSEMAAWSIRGERGRRTRKNGRPCGQRDRGGPLDTRCLSHAA